MKRKNRRRIAGLLVLVMITALLCIPSQAASSVNAYGFDRYVAMGDSISHGLTEKYHSGPDFGCYATGYASLLAGRLGLTEGVPTVTQPGYNCDPEFYTADRDGDYSYSPWAYSALRSREILYQLDGGFDYTEDEFTRYWLHSEIPQMDVDRDLLHAQLQKADLITLGVGSNDVLIGPMMITIWEMADARGMRRGDMEDIVKGSIGFGTVPDDVEFDKTEIITTFLKGMLPRLMSGYREFLVNFPNILGEIRNLNPDAQIVLVGLSNPLHDLSLTGKLPVSLGEMLDGVLAPMNLVIAGVGASYGCTYVDATDVKLDSSVHPSMNEGCPDIADRIQSRLRARTNFKDVATLSSENRLAVRWGEISRNFAGTSDTRFSPYTAVTRAQFVQAVYNMAGTPEPESSASFRDVSAKADYAKAVAWAAENGIVAGTSKNYFSPNLALTKKQAVTILYKYDLLRAENGLGTARNYSDALTWAADQGITKGFSNVAMKTATLCTRAQAVLFLYRYAGVM